MTPVAGFSNCGFKVLFGTRLRTLFSPLPLLLLPLSASLFLSPSFPPPPLQDSPRPRAASAPPGPVPSLGKHQRTRREARPGRSARAGRARRGPRRRGGGRGGSGATPPAALPPPKKPICPVHSRPWRPRSGRRRLRASLLPQRTTPRRGRPRAPKLLFLRRRRRGPRAKSGPVRLKKNSAARCGLRPSERVKCARGFFW